MKKIILFLIIFLLSVNLAYAQISVGNTIGTVFDSFVGFLNNIGTSVTNFFAANND